MTSGGIQTLIDGYAALAARDEKRLLACIDEDVELRTMTGSYRGHEGIRRWLADMDEGWSSWAVSIHGARQRGHRVLVEATLSGRSSVNDIFMSHPFWVVWDVRDGLAVRGVHFDEPEGALREVGLTPPSD